jgi:ABC-type Fe3+ transport system substrate-binding protein
LVEQAQAEGTVVVAGPPVDEVRLQLSAAFQERFGIGVEYLSGRSGEQAERIAAEAAAGVHEQDVFIGAAGVTFGQLIPRKLVEDMRSVLVGDEVLDPASWRSGEVPFLDEAQNSALALALYRFGYIAVNTDVVDEGEITTWSDVLDPKWRGKIVMDNPAFTGPGVYDVATLLEAKGEDFVEDLYVGQQPLFLRDYRQAVEGVVRGTHPLGISLTPDPIDEAIEQGLPIDLVYLEDAPVTATSGVSLLSLIADAPHRSAAVLLVNWLACAEGNEVFNAAMGTNSSRSDVDTGAERYQIPADGAEVSNTSTYQWFSEVRGPTTEYITDLLGG